MLSNSVCGIKLSPEEKKELARMEMRNVISALLGTVIVVILGTIFRVAMHDATASINVFFGALFVIVLMIWGHVRRLVVLRIRDDLSKNQH
jgi:hypothetical protein